MNITNWTSKELIKYIATHAGMTQGKLGLQVFAKTNQNYKISAFNNKVARNDLKLKELQAACEILGYRLKLEEIK